MPITTSTPYLPAMLVYAPAGRVDRHGNPYRRFRVRIKGKDHQLGPWGPDGSPEHERAFEKYRSLVLDLQRFGEPVASPADLTVNGLIKIYLAWLEESDEKTSPRGRSAANASSILKQLGRTAHGDEPAQAFTIPMLFRWRETLAETENANGNRLSRGYINSKVCPTVVRMFRWAEERGRMEGERWKGKPKEIITPLAARHTTAPNLDPRQAVAIEVVKATLPHLPEYVRDIVSLIGLTGARPSEICRLTPSMLDRSRADVWIADLHQHKTARHGKARVLSFDAAAQEILSHHLDPHRLFAPIFTAGRFMDTIVRKRHAVRASKPTPAQLDAIAKASAARMEDAEPLDPSILQDHVRRACDAHDVEHWTVYQLRHLHLTEAAMLVDGETAQHVAGHSSAAMTARYRHDEADRAVKARRAVNAAKAQTA